MSAPVIIACLIAASAAAQTAREVRGAAAVVPLQNEPPAKIVIDPPLAQALSRGAVVIQYRAENLHIVPVFGPAALAVSPRVGHIHVTVDDTPWVWADASGEPLIVQGLPPVPHKILIQLETANHQLLDQGTVNFKVSDASDGSALAASAAAHTGKEAHGAAHAQALQNEPPAKIIIDSPATGRHKMLIELANAIHQTIDQGTVQFTIPAPKAYTSQKF